MSDSPVSTQSQKRGAKPRVLVAEGDAALRYDHVVALRVAGLRTMQAVEGYQALNKALLFLPDVVICDLELPELDGFELSAWLYGQDRTRHIPVIGITSSPFVDLDRAKQARIKRLVLVPCPAATIVAEVLRAIERARTVGAMSRPARSHAPAASPVARVSLPCPTCGCARRTEELARHGGQQLLCCGDCGHVWRCGVSTTGA